MIKINAWCQLKLVYLPTPYFFIFVGIHIFNYFGKLLHFQNTQHQHQINSTRIDTRPLFRLSKRLSLNFFLDKKLSPKQIVIVACTILTQMAGPIILYCSGIIQDFVCILYNIRKDNKKLNDFSFHTTLIVTQYISSLHYTR